MTTQIINLYSIQFIQKIDYEPRHTTYTQNITKRSVDDFIRKISQENWITVYLQNNPENAYDNFLNTSTPITIPASQSKRRPQNPIDLTKIGVHWIL